MSTKVMSSAKVQKSNRLLADELLFLHFDRAKARERKSGTLLSSALRTVLAGGLLFCTEICDKM